MFHIYCFLQPLDIDIFFSVIDAVNYQRNPGIEAFFFRDGGCHVVVIALLGFMLLAFVTSYVIQSSRTNSWFECGRNKKAFNMDVLSALLTA